MKSPNPSADTAPAVEAEIEKRVCEIEARARDLQKQLATPHAEVQTALGTVDAILGQLTQRVLALEKDYFQLRSLVVAQQAVQTLPDRQRRVDASIANAQLQMAGIQAKLSDYENLVGNVKKLVGRAAADVHTQRSAGMAATPKFVPLKAKGCTQEDLDSDWAAFWAGEIHMPIKYQRKLWELCYVPQILFNEGKLCPGNMGLSFACGSEPLPSLFAKYGVAILATDLAPDRAEAAGWLQSGQHIAGFEKVRRRDICPEELRLSTIECAYLDMNAIPSELDGKFDFCWSVCSLEHLGGIPNGLNFIEHSLRTLKPGGISVHTAEFNLKEGPTIETGPTVLFQKRHFLELAARLRSQGHHVYDFDFDSGQGVLDGFVDVPPFIDENYRCLSPDAHLKLSMNGYICTSFGFIVKKSEQQNT